MKTFDEIYEELQNQEDSELNNAWKNAKKESEKSKKIAITICLIIDIFAVIVFWGKRPGFFALPVLMFPIVINIFVFAATKMFFSKGHNNYTKTYKDIVINKLINNFYTNLEYFPNKPMPEYIYNQANYNEHYDIYDSEDYFEGQINNKYSIQMAEVLTQEERTYKNSDGDTETEIITIFHGLFSKIVMHKSINGELRIVRNGKLMFDRKRLEMDSSEFEKYFDVKSSDKILGMRLLTADVMEELINFQNKTNMEYDVYIKDNELYLRFHSGEMFEAGKLKNGPLDKEDIRKYFYMLNFTYNLSNKLINLVNDMVI